MGYVGYSLICHHKPIFVLRLIDVYAPELACVDRHEVVCGAISMVVDMATRAMFPEKLYVFSSLYVTFSQYHFPHHFVIFVYLAVIFPVAFVTGAAMQALARYVGHRAAVVFYALLSALFWGAVWMVDITL